MIRTDITRSELTIARQFGGLFFNCIITGGKGVGWVIDMQRFILIFLACLSTEPEEKKMCIMSIYKNTFAVIDRIMLNTLMHYILNLKTIVNNVTHSH